MNPLHKATSIRIFLNEKTTAVPHAVIYFPRNGIKFGKNNFTKIEFDLSSFDTVSGVDLKETRPVTVKSDSRKYHNSRAAALREVGEGKYFSGRWSIGEHRSITIDLALTGDRCVGTVICEQKKKTPISAVMKREGINGTEIRLEFNNTRSAAMAAKMVIESTKTVSNEKGELSHSEIIEMIKGDKELYHKIACFIRRDRSTLAPRENNLVKQSDRFLEEFEQECEAVPASEESDFINAPKTVDETTFDNVNDEPRKVLVIEVAQLTQAEDRQIEEIIGCEIKADAQDPIVIDLKPLRFAQISRCYLPVESVSFSCTMSDPEPEITLDELLYGLDLSLRSESSLGVHQHELGAQDQEQADEREETKAEARRAALMQRRCAKNKREGVGEDLAKETAQRATQEADDQAVIVYQEQQIGIEYTNTDPVYRFN